MSQPGKPSHTKHKPKAGATKGTHDKSKPGTPRQKDGTTSKQTAPKTSKEPKQPSTPKPQESVTKEEAQPHQVSAHQIKQLLHCIWKTEGKATIGVLKASIGSNQSLKRLSSGSALEDLLGELTVFRLDRNDGDGRMVKACTDLEICDPFSADRSCLLGDLCPKLHICKKYILEQKCTNKDCGIGHNLKDDHNMPIMKSGYLDILSHDNVKTMLQQGYCRQIFKACVQHSNKGCKFKDQCRKVHVCKYFLQNRCQAKGQCRRSHDLSGPQPKALLAKHGMDPENHAGLVMQEMRDAYLFQSGDADDPDSDAMSSMSHSSTGKLHQPRKTGASPRSPSPGPMFRGPRPGPPMMPPPLVGPPYGMHPPMDGYRGPPRMPPPLMGHRPPHMMRYPPPGPPHGVPDLRDVRPRGHGGMGPQPGRPPLLAYPPAAPYMYPPPAPGIGPGEDPQKKKPSRGRRRDQRNTKPSTETLQQQNKAVHAVLFKVCDAGGTMQLKELFAFTSQSPDLNRIFHSDIKNLEKMLRKCPNVFRLKREGDEITVEAFTGLGRCTHFGARDGCTDEACEKLHLCRNYITNTCRFGKADKAGNVANPCRYGHGIREPHNLRLLRQHHLDRIPTRHVKMLVMKNDQMKATPQVCRFYNSPKGCKHTAGRCFALHFCRRHLNDKCTAGRHCSKCHSVIDPHVRNILIRHGIDMKRPKEDILTELREMLGTDDKADSVVGDQEDQELSDDDDNLMAFSESDSSEDLMAFSGDSSSEDELIHISSSSDNEQPEPEPLFFQPAHPVNPLEEMLIPGLPKPFVELGKASVEKMLILDLSEPFSEVPKGGASAALAGLSLLDEEPAPEICLYFLRGQCSYKESCKNYHTPTSYQWQRRVGGVWTDLPTKENQEIEVNFCDPSNMECFTGDPLTCPTKIDFKDMILTEAGKAKDSVMIRRLSTPASVAKPAHYQHTTNWQWYWKDDHKEWVEYGGADPVRGLKANISSKDIEEKYFQDPSGGTILKTPSGTYYLDFRKMKQKNLENNSERHVLRRPTLHVAEKKSEDMSTLMDMIKMLTDKVEQLDTKRGGDSQSDAVAEPTVAIPKQWATDSVMEARGFQLVPLPTRGKGKQEYKQVEQLFSITMGDTPIKSVKRIQNLELWDAFQRKKVSMQKNLPEGATVNERHLFHGTSRRYMDAICQQGFDWRVSGLSVGTKYGKGSYFARDAKFSSSYTDCNSFFLVRVLVGESAKGKQDIVRPPPKNPRNPYVDLYDSCVDNVANPSIFVIFNMDQAYPEWLVEY